MKSNPDLLVVGSDALNYLDIAVTQNFYQDIFSKIVYDPNKIQHEALKIPEKLYKKLYNNAATFLPFFGLQNPHKVRCERNTLPFYSLQGQNTAQIGYLRMHMGQEYLLNELKFFVDTIEISRKYKRVEHKKVLHILRVDPLDMQFDIKFTRENLKTIIDVCDNKSSSIESIQRDFVLRFRCNRIPNNQKTIEKRIISVSENMQQLTANKLVVIFDHKEFFENNEFFINWLKMVDRDINFVIPGELAYSFLCHGIHSYNQEFVRKTDVSFSKFFSLNPIYNTVRNIQTIRSCLEFCVKNQQEMQFLVSTGLYFSYITSFYETWTLPNFNIAITLFREMLKLLKNNPTHATRMRELIIKCLPVLDFDSLLIEVQASADEFLDDVAKQALKDAMKHNKTKLRKLKKALANSSLPRGF